MGASSLKCYVVFTYLLFVVTLFGNIITDESLFFSNYLLCFSPLLALVTLSPTINIILFSFELELIHFVVFPDFFSKLRFQVFDLLRVFFAFFSL